MKLTDIGINFLLSIGTTQDTASASDMSKACSYESCYNWYITVQKVLPENAALASKVWVQKYCLIDENGICVEKDPTQMWDRLANELATVEVAGNPTNKSHPFWKNYFKKGCFSAAIRADYAKVFPLFYVKSNVFKY